MRSAASCSASQRLGGARLARGAHLGRRHAQADLAEVDAVELLRQLDERRIAAVRTSRRIAADGGVDILRRPRASPPRNEANFRAKSGSAVESHFGMERPASRPPRVQWFRSFLRSSRRPAGHRDGGVNLVAQAAPRSCSSASMHSTCSLMARRRKMQSDEVPSGARAGSKRIGQQATAPCFLILQIDTVYLGVRTRSKRSAGAGGANSGSRSWASGLRSRGPVEAVGDGAKRCSGFK